MTQKRMAFQSLDGHNITEDADSFSECVTSTGGPYVCAGEYTKLRNAVRTLIHNYDFGKLYDSVDADINTLRRLI